MEEPIYTVGIICPLPKELDAVLATFDEGPYEVSRPPDTTIPFRVGKIGSRYVVAACLPEDNIGLVPASYLGNKMNAAFPDLELRFLVGIAGGLPTHEHDIRLGDVVIAKSIFKYDAGKYVKGHISWEGGRWHLERAPRALSNALSLLTSRERAKPEGLLEQHLLSMRTKKPELQYLWKRPPELEDVLFEADYDCLDPGTLQCSSCDGSRRVVRPPRSNPSPQIFRGLVASGDIVLKDGLRRSELQKSILDYFRETVFACEMEAASLQEFGYIVVRGICDYADAHKNKQWQDYAAATAAACFEELLSCFVASEASIKSRTTSQAASDYQKSLPQRVNTNLSAGSETSTPSDSRSFPHRFRAESRPPSAIISEDDQSPIHCPSWQQDTSLRQNERGLLEATVLSYRIELHDIPLRKDNPTESTVIEGNSAQLQVTQLVQGTAFETDRRFIIESENKNNQSFSYWLPLDAIQFSKEGTEVRLQFSDCRKKTPESVNYSKRYSCSHDSTNPNVTVVLHLENDYSCKEIRNLLLHSSSVKLPDYQLIKKFQVEIDSGPCELRSYTTMDKPRTDNQNNLDYRVLMVESLSDPIKTTMFYFDDMLDFEVKVDGEDREVQIRLLKRIRYRPVQAKWATWPPPWVEENVEGRPDHVSLEGEQILSFHIPKDLKLTDLLPALIGWNLAFCGSDIDFRHRSGSAFTRNSFRKAQISIWSRESEVRLVCLTHDGDEQQKWVTSRLPQPKALQGDPGPYMKPNPSGKTVILEDTPSSKGASIVLSSFMAEQKDEKTSTKKRYQEFKFEHSSVFQGFVDTLENFVASPRSDSPVPAQTYEMERRQSRLSVSAS